MEINKVVFGSDTIIDISDTTASEGDVLANKYFYKADGTRASGMAQALTIDSALSSTSENPVQNKVITAKVGLDGLNTVAQDLSGAVNEILGAIPSTAADVNAIAAPSSATTNYILAYNGSNWSADKRTFIASYGSSTYAEILSAYQANAIMYCRASSNANPATGNQLRLAFLAYVNNETTPTEFEFQYYRSVATHTVSQQGDQVFVYKINSAGTWSVTTREAYTRIVASTGLSSAYSNGVLTITNAQTASTATPAALGTASAGTSSTFARGDHVHPMPSATDVGAIATPTSAASGSLLGYNGSSWVGVAPPSFIDIVPSSGIPSSALSASVQSSLALADTALQSAPEEIFWAIQSETDFGDVYEAYYDNKTVLAKDLDNKVYVLSELSGQGYCLFYNIIQDISDNNQCYVYWLYLDGGGWDSGSESIGTYSKPASGIPASDIATGVIPSASSTTPQALGTAAAGSSSYFSRADHVHAMPSAADVGALPNTTVIPSAGTITPKDAGTASAGTSTYFARADHVHNTQLIEATYGSTTASEIVSNFLFVNKYIAVYCERNNIYHWLTSYQFGGDSFPYIATFTGIYNNTLSILTVNESTWSTSSYTLPSASNATPQALGTASAGSSSDFSRSDHVHAIPSAIDVGAIAAPASASDEDILIYSSSLDTWIAQTQPTEIFWATYNTTTTSEVEAAYQAGKLICVIKDYYTYVMYQRNNETNHQFTSMNGYYARYLSLNSDVWSAGVTYTLAQTYQIPSASDTTPQTLGEAAAGTASSFSRSDHVHAMPSALDVGIVIGSAVPTTGDITPGQIYLKYS